MTKTAKLLAILAALNAGACLADEDTEIPPTVVEQEPAIVHECTARTMEEHHHLNLEEMANATIDGNYYVFKVLDIGKGSDTVSFEMLSEKPLESTTINSSPGEITTVNGVALYTGSFCDKGIHLFAGSAYITKKDIPLSIGTPTEVIFGDEENPRTYELEITRDLEFKGRIISETDSVDTSDKAYLMETDTLTTLYDLTALTMANTGWLHTGNILQNCGKDTFVLYERTSIGPIGNAVVHAFEDSTLCVPKE